VETATFARGFVELVEIPTLSFLENAALLFRMAPVLDVHLPDKEPVPHFCGAGAFWLDGREWNDAAASLPPELWCRLPAGLGIAGKAGEILSRTVAGARVAFSTGCVPRGRALVGLPPLD